MKFTLEIELGNEAMQRYPEIAKAIQSSLLTYHDAVSLSGAVMAEDSGTVRDENGNTVGRWEVAVNASGE